MNKLIQQIVSWAQVAYNWLKNFFRIVWGYIKSLWPKLKTAVKEWIKEAKEVIILDGRESGGHEMLQALRNERPVDISIDDISNLVALVVNSNNSIAKVNDLEAEIQEHDQYDTMAQQSNGILRING